MLAFLKTLLTEFLHYRKSQELIFLRIATKPSWTPMDNVEILCKLEMLSFDVPYVAVFTLGHPTRLSQWCGSVTMTEKQ